jgi:hypothetical protein
MKALLTALLIVASTSLLYAQSPAFNDPAAQVRSFRDLLQDVSVANGDVNADRSIDVSDALYILNFLFKGGPAPAPVSCPDSADLPFYDGVGVDKFSLEFHVDESSGEAQVKLSVKTERELTAFLLKSPTGEVVFNLQSGDGGPLELEEVEFQTVELPLAATAAMYPPGEYTVETVTSTGVSISSGATLSHAVPPAPAYTTQLSAETFTVEWPEVAGASGYQVEIEQEETRFKMKLNLSSDQRRVEIPRQLLEAGYEYELDVASVSSSGNTSEAQTTFSISDSVSNVD